MLEQEPLKSAQEEFLNYCPPVEYEKLMCAA